MAALPRRDKGQTWETSSPGDAEAVSRFHRECTGGNSAGSRPLCGPPPTGPGLVTADPRTHLSELGDRDRQRLDHRAETRRLATMAASAT